MSTNKVTNMPKGKTAKAAPKAEPVAEATESASPIGRAIILPNGEKRADFCRRRFAEGAKRGDIARELSEMTGTKVPYQIVFAATKPKKAEAAEGEAATE